MLKKIAVLLTILGLAFVLLLLTTGESRFELRSSAMMSGSQEQVWQILVTIEEWPQWWPGVERARLTGGLVSGSDIDLRMKGQPGEDPARLIIVTPPTELVWERPGVLNSRAGTRFLLEEGNDGCSLTVENFIQGPQAVLARITGKDAFAEYQQQMLKNLELYLRAKLAAAGEKD